MPDPMKMLKSMAGYIVLCFSNLDRHHEAGIAEPTWLEPVYGDGPDEAPTCWDLNALTCGGAATLVRIYPDFEADPSERGHIARLVAHTPYVVDELLAYIEDLEAERISSLDREARALADLERAASFANGLVDERDALHGAFAIMEARVQRLVKAAREVVNNTTQFNDGDHDGLISALAPFGGREEE